MITIKDYDNMTMEELMLEIKIEYKRLLNETEKLTLENNRLRTENARLLRRLQHSEAQRFAQFYN